MLDLLAELSDDELRRTHNHENDILMFLKQNQQVIVLQKGVIGMREYRDPQRLAHGFIVDRLLNWAAQARRDGRELRADFLIEVAWQAYDEGCAKGYMLEVA